MSQFPKELLRKTKSKRIVVIKTVGLWRSLTERHIRGEALSLTLLRSSEVLDIYSLLIMVAT